jgi:hypothetical protein
MHQSVETEIPFPAAHAIEDVVQSAVKALDNVDQAFAHVEPV